MFNTSNGYSLSDIAAVSGNNRSGGFGDGDYWWIILLFLFAGNGNWGFGGNGGGSLREEVSYGFSMNGLENGIRGIQQGLCDGFYAMNTGMLNGFAGVDRAITASTFASTSGIHDLSTQIAQCCCDTTRAVADASRDIIASNEAGVRSILDFLTQDKIATLTAENQALKFAASQSAQNAFITANQEAQTARLINQLQTPSPVPAYVVPNPNGYYATACGC